MPLRWFKFSHNCPLGEEEGKKENKKKTLGEKFLEKESLFKKGFYFSFRTEQNLICRTSAIKTVKVEFGQDRFQIHSHITWHILSKENTVRL